MADLILGAETISVPPFHLDKLELAADLIDAVNASLANRDGTWKALTASYRPIMAIAAIGLSISPETPQGERQYPTSADDLMAKATLKDAPAIFDFFSKVLEEAGLQKAGEPEAGGLSLAQGNSTATDDPSAPN